MKKWLILIFGLILACLIILIFIKPFSGKQSSRIVQKVVKVEGKVVAKYKVAELPEEERTGKPFDTLDGKVVIIPNNPEDINSRMMVAIKKDSEIIVVTNPEYVRTLGYLYFDRGVHLKGKWQKDAVIFGKKYRAFKVEDINLAKKGIL